MGRKISYRATEAQLLCVVEGLRQAKLRSEIINELRERFSIGLKRAQDIYAEGLKYIDAVTIANAQEYKSILLDRLEAQYKDTFLIEDVSKRIQRQRELVDSMAKISGVLQNTVNMINIFEYYPEVEARSGGQLESSIQHGLPPSDTVLSRTIQNLIDENVVDTEAVLIDDDIRSS